jgi:hypothetical protein
MIKTKTKAKTETKTNAGLRVASGVRAGGFNSVNHSQAPRR